MAITLASDSHSDAEVTDGICRGDLSSAARLWVRYWQTALSAARLYADPPEAPGLAAEALVGTVSLIAIGRGPRDDVASFISAAVRELGEDDGPPMVMHADSDHPELFESARMTATFADLHHEDQEVLRTSIRGGLGFDEDSARALTVLQTSYLTTHLDSAPTSECRAAHIAMMANAGGTSRDGFARQHWLHLSSCAWCTEAFHELAFTNIALDALIADSVLNPVAPTPVVYERALFAPEPAIEPGPPPVGAHEAPLPVLAPVIQEPADAAVLEPPPEPLIVQRPGLVELARDARHRLIAVGTLAAGVTIVVGLLLTKSPDTTSPTAANSGPNAAAATTPGPSADSNLGAPAGPGESEPTTGASVAGPLEIASPSDPFPSAKATKTTRPKPTPKPSSKPTTNPDPDPAPTQPAPSQPATSAPEPSPSATPTKHCTTLEHILGFC